MSDFGHAWLVHDDEHVRTHNHDRPPESVS
jgi:hypothetical protein